jgi:hypothetical protein
MAQTATLKRSKRGGTCSICGERISAGAFCYLNAGDVWHTDCADAKRRVAASPAAAATSVVALVPARPAPCARVFGCLAVDGASFRAWEREYDEEGR